MIKGHNPNRLQKALLKANNYNWNEWLVVKVYTDNVLFRNKLTDETITLYYDESVKRI